MKTWNKVSPRYRTFRRISENISHGDFAPEEIHTEEEEGKRVLVINLSLIILRNAVI
jgi:hypothetical protein